MDSEQYREDFLWVAYFGITQTEATKDSELCIAKCIDRAYLDLNRTIHYRISVTQLSEMKREASDPKDKEDARAFEEQKKKFRDDVRAYLKGQIDQLLPMQSISKDWFDKEWHGVTCQHIMELADGCNRLLDKPLSFGQAQKWVNMTLKYMLIMDVANLENIVEFMHVPIDSYILKAAAKNKGESIHESVDAKGLDVTPSFQEKWSAIADHEKYLQYQEDIRRALGKGTYPIFWEGPAWIAQAKAEADKLA